MQYCRSAENRNTATPAGGPGSGETTSAYSKRNRIDGAGNANAWGTSCQNFALICSSVIELWIFFGFFNNGSESGTLCFVGNFFFSINRYIYGLHTIYLFFRILCIVVAIKEPVYWLMCVIVSLFFRSGLRCHPAPESVNKIKKCVIVKCVRLHNFRWNCIFPLPLFFSLCDCFSLVYICTLLTWINYFE